MYENYQPAIEHFKKGIEAFPDDRYMAAMYSGLGKAYLAQNERKLALANFRKAIDSARKQSDPNLADYQSLLDEM